MTNPIEKLVESVPSWGAKLSYGEKTTVDGQELLPVALVAFGFGGGGGSAEMPEGGISPVKTGEGSGGGGGGYSLPIGAYIAGPDGPTFRPNPLAVAVLAVPLVSAVGWALSRVLRATR